MRPYVAAAAILAVISLTSPVAAQTSWTTPGGAGASGYVTMCLNGSGLAVPCSSTTTGAVTQAGGPWTVSGFESGPVAASGTPANSSHSAGTAVGPTGSGSQTGLFSIPVARVNGGSGIITSFLIKDTNGTSAQSYVLRAWSKLPSNTTCKDATAFAGSATDDQYLIGGGPVTITTAAPGSTTGDSAYYASLTGLTWDYLNADSPTTQYVYACLVTTGTYTPAASKPIYLTLSGPQN